MRILRDNRRERGRRGADLSDYLLYAFRALLSLVRFFPKGKGRGEGPERLSTRMDRELREWHRERSGA